MKTTIGVNPDDLDPRRKDPIQPAKCEGNGNGSLYGSRELSQEILAVCRQPVHTPVVDKRYIQAIAISRGSDGEHDVRDTSGRQFGRDNSELEGQTRQLVNVVKLEEAGAARHCKDASARLEQTPPTIIHHREGQPWTKYSVALVVFLILVSLAALAMGINTNATVLISSGIPAFENPLRAYCFSMVPILLATAIKILGSLFENQSHRHYYTFAICATGIFLGILWAASFAKTYPGLTQSVTDIVQSLAATDGAHANPTGSGWMIFISILAESCLAGGCWLMIQVTCDRHQKTIVEPNPAYESLQAELDAWCKRRNENRRLAGLLAGKLNAISDARKHFIEDCVGHFHAALKVVVDHDGLRDFLND